MKTPVRPEVLWALLLITHFSPEVMSLICGCTSRLHSTHTRQEAEGSLRWQRLLFMCRPLSRCENYAQHRARKASPEPQCFSTHRDYADENLFTAGQGNVLEHIESPLLQPGAQERSLSCSRQEPCSAGCSNALNAVCSGRSSDSSGAGSKKQVFSFHSKRLQLARKVHPHQAQPAGLCAGS